VLCIPAIDIRNGTCVRLIQGDFAKETIYGDPLEVALAYREAGARVLHIVDLDAARTGKATNRGLIRKIIEECPIEVEVGGGIRSSVDAEALIDIGAARVVLGTAAIENPAFARDLAHAHPLKVAIGLDHRPVRQHEMTRREVALRGWVQGSGIALADAFATFNDAPFGAVIVTDIDRDGTLLGPDLPGVAFALEMSALPVISSGGIATQDDLLALGDVQVNGVRLYGAIVGTALLSGAMTLQEALIACAR
jgi:phosphoribosylformimino-5-aminoimidazole carboxamide ribotide isomerase